MRTKQPKLFKIYFKNRGDDVEVRLVGKGPRAQIYTLDWVYVKDSTLAEAVNGAELAAAIGEHGLVK